MKKTILLTTFLCSIIAIILSVLNIYNTKKIRGVDLYKLSDNYNLKKNLESMMNKDLNNRKNEIDSLDKSIGLYIENKVDKKTVDSMINLWKSKSVNFEKEFEEVNSKISAQVWNRLNPIIKEFSEKNNYEILIGGNGSGNILFLNDKADVTDELIEYANSRYEK